MAKPEQQKPDAAKPDPKARGKALFSVFNGVVDSQIAGDKSHGWGNADSMAVIESIVAEDAALSDGDVKQFTLSEEAMKLIAIVVNPSAFRQQLESKDDGRLTKVEGKRAGSLKSLKAEFGS